MNPLDLLLRDELNRLLDRIAASTGTGTVRATERHLPELRTRLDEAEARLAQTRETLLAHYAQWQAALEACEDLWALTRLELEPTQGGVLRAA